MKSSCNNPGNVFNPIQESPASMAGLLELVIDCKFYGMYWTSSSGRSLTTV